MSKAPASTFVAPENLGVRTLSFEDAKRNRPVVVELWYPSAQVGSIDTPPDVAWIHPNEVRDVTISKGKRPLIVMSHGHGGDRRDRSWLAEHLVKNGFIVASVEHHGNSWKTYNPLLSLRFWERSRDVSFTIDQLLKEPGLKTQIDPKRIGFVGYSLGGMTGLSLAGAKAKNVKEIAILLQQQNKEIELEHIEKIDFTEAHGDFSDKRIKAFVLLSPAAFVFPEQSLKEVKVPVAVVASEGDEVLPFKDHAYKVITHMAPKKLKLLREKASHYVYLNRVSERGKELLAERIHSDEIQEERVAVHKEVGALSVEFFKEHLK